MSNRGIDYGMGQTNIDKETGIRYGVISANALNPDYVNDFEPDYGEPHCPHCGNPAVTVDSEIEIIPQGASVNLDSEFDRDDYERDCGACGDYVCDDCKRLFDGDTAFGDEPVCHYLDDNEYKATLGSDNDIFILKSPYFTRAQFCSPCAPGACYLTNPADDGEKTYCFAQDWFDDEYPCPYKIWRVDTGELIFTPAESTDD